MTITTSFRYAKPETITDAVELLAEAGPKGRVLAGGTDLVGWLKDNLIEPELLVDIKGIESLRELSLANEKLTIGALTTMTDILKSELIRESSDRSSFGSRFTCRSAWCGALRRK